MKMAVLLNVFLVLLIKTASGLFDDNCRYEYNISAERCIRANQAVEQQLSHLEAMQEQNLERVNSITSAYSQEFSVLAKDTGALKAVTNRLVEDSVQIEGRLRILQDVGADVQGMRNKMDLENKKLTTMISDVSGRLERQTTAQTLVAARMSSQMKDNNELLTGLQSKVMNIEDRLSKLGPGQQGNNPESSQLIEELQGQLAEVTSKLDSNIQFYNGQIRAIISAVNQMQQRFRQNQMVNVK